MIKKILGWTATIIVAIPVLYLAAMFMAYLGLIAFSIIASIFNIKEEVKSHEFNIYAFEDNVSYVVSRYGGSNESLRYYFTRKIDEGYKVGYLPSGDSYIYETDTTPRVEVYIEEPKYFKKLYHGLMDFARVSPVYSKYKIYIPKDTVTKEYNVDLN